MLRSRTRTIIVMTVAATLLLIAVPALAAAPTCDRATRSDTSVALDRVHVDLRWEGGAEWQAAEGSVRVAARLADGTTVGAEGASGSIPGAVVVKICLPAEPFASEKLSTTTVPAPPEKPATTSTTVARGDKHPTTTTTAATILTSSTSMVSTTTTVVAANEEPATTTTAVTAPVAPTPPKVPATVPVEGSGGPEASAKPDDAAASSRWIAQHDAPAERPTIRVRPATAQAPPALTTAPAIQVLPAQLPQTGADWMPYAITAVALIGLGGLAVARSRRAATVI